MLSDSQNKKKHLDKIIIVLVFFISTAFYFSAPSQYISDDSLFYLVIAQHIIESDFSSFNGYIKTNGYHPLWMIFNIIGIKIGLLLNIKSLIIIGFIYQSFIAGSIWLIFKIDDILKTYSALIVSTIIIFLFISNGSLHNMESSLALFFVLYTIYFILIKSDPSTKNFFKIGILLGLTLLSRLDLIFFGVIIAFYILVAYKKYFVSSPKQLLCFMGGGLLIVIPYFIYNELTFGGITPVSGALKSSFPNIEFSLGNIFPYGIITSFFALIAVIIVFLTKSKSTKIVFIVLSLSSIVHAVYLAMFQDGMNWYYITGYLIFALVIGYLIRKINIKLISVLLTFILFLFTLSTSYIKSISDFTLSTHLLHGKKLNFSTESQMKKFADTLKKKIPNNSTIFTWDVPGVLAYYGKFNVFSADGLITNKTYQKELVELGAMKLFELYGISHIVVPLSEHSIKYYDGMLFQPLENDKYLITIYSRLYHIPVGTIQLSTKDIQFTLSSPYTGTDNNSPFIGVFKIPSSNEEDVWLTNRN